MTDTDNTFDRRVATETVARYAAAMSAADVEALAGLFTEDATRRDPVQGPLVQGRSGIRDAFAAVLPSDDTVGSFVAGTVRGAGPVVAFPFEYTVRIDGGTTTTSGIDVFTLTPAGMISDAVAYWGDDDIEHISD